MGTGFVTLKLIQHLIVPHLTPPLGASPPQTPTHHLRRSVVAKELSLDVSGLWCKVWPQRGAYAKQGKNSGSTSEVVEV